jgi:hypothetical protein
MCCRGHPNPNRERLSNNSGDDPSDRDFSASGSDAFGFANRKCDPIIDPDCKRDPIGRTDRGR